MGIMMKTKARHKKIFRAILAGMFFAIGITSIRPIQTDAATGNWYTRYPLYYGEVSVEKSDRAKAVKNRNNYIRGLLDDKWTAEFYGFMDTNFEKYPNYHISDAERKAIDDSCRKMDKKTDQIVKGKKSDMAKFKAIHKWVTKNIYYDYDAVNGKEEYRLDAWNAFAYRRTTCWGYAAIESYMLKHCGIHCVIAYGKALYNGEWEDADDFNDGGHSWVMAYIDGKWYSSDPTWDSGNRYENGQYITNILEWKWFCFSDKVGDATHAIRAINRNELAKKQKTGFFQENGKVYYYYYGNKVTNTYYKAKYEDREISVGVWHDDRMGQKIITEFNEDGSVRL